MFRLLLYFDFPCKKYSKNAKVKRNDFINETAIQLEQLILAKFKNARNRNQISIRNFGINPKMCILQYLHNSEIKKQNTNQANPLH